jgi:prepilin-type N-terminal cleavage/methylation domain-containing protein
VTRRRRRWRHRPVRRGFTLLELLLALGLFTLFAGVLYGSYLSASRTIARCQVGYEPFRETMMVRTVVSRMLASASASRQKNPKATFAGDEARLSFTSLNRQGYDPGWPCPIAFVRIAHDRDEGLSVETHPTYFLDDRQQESTWRRRFFRRVRSLKIRYADATGDWLREWEATKKGKLPARVKLEMELAGEASSSPLPFAFEVALPIQSDLPITGVPVVPAAGAAPAGGAPGYYQGGFPGQAPGAPLGTGSQPAAAGSGAGGGAP